MANSKKYNCTKNGKQYYRLTRTIDGKKKEFYGDGKKDAERKAEEYIKKLKDEAETREKAIAAGYDPDASSVLFREGIEEWFFKIKKMECKKLSTFDRYEIMLRKQVLECGLCKTCTLCNSKIRDVSRSMIKNCVLKMEKSPVKTAGNIDSFLTITKLYFEYLLDEEIVSGINPCRKLKAVRAPEIEQNREEKYIDRELREKMKNVLNSESEVVRIALFLDFNSGLRQGELCGLEWDKDVIWDSGLMVRQTVSYTRVFDEETREHHMELLLQAPKGNRSRFVALPSYVWPILKEYQDWQRREFMKNGWGKPQTILHSKDGGILIPKNLRDAFRRIQKKCGEENFKRFHDIRHSYITDLAVDENIPLPVVQSTAGHTDLKITEGYIHTKQNKNVSILKDIVAF